MPRIVSWEINGSLWPIPAAMVLRHMKGPYDMIDDDPWEYYAVTASQDRRFVTIFQKARFGIGDVYFLSRYFGACEVVVGTVKRLSPHTVHLDNGRKLDDVAAVLKLLGFVGDWQVDRLFQLKSMTGFWPNADYRRGTFSEFPTMNAQKFGGTSYSPGAIQVTETFMHLLDFPLDFKRMIDTGMLPVHKPDISKDEPGYVFDAKVGAQTMITISSVVPWLAERAQFLGPFKRQRQWETHSLDEVLDCASQEWYKYCEMFKSYGYEKPIPEYPYTLQSVRAMIKENDDEGSAQARVMAEKQASAIAEGRF